VRPGAAGSKRAALKYLSVRKATCFENLYFGGTQHRFLWALHICIHQIRLLRRWGNRHIAVKKTLEQNLDECFRAVFCRYETWPYSGWSLFGMLISSFPRLWARRWKCDARPVLRQTYDYLPILRWYQINTAWWQRHVCVVCVSVCERLVQGCTR